LVVQQALEQEVVDSLGRDSYARRNEGQQGLRNGYEAGRIRSAEGEIRVLVPQVHWLKTLHRSKLMGFLQGNSGVLEYLVVQMYTRGLSKWDIEGAFLEERRRTNAIPRFFDERSCLKLVFATLWQASQRWQNVRMSHVERQQLNHLRRQLKLDETEEVTEPIAKPEPVEAVA
jgi:transposase-like protein